MPNIRRYSATQSVHSFSFLCGPRFYAFSSSPDVTLFGYLWSLMQSSAPTTTTFSCARLLRYSHIRFAGGPICRRGWGCSSTCVRLLGSEAKTCVVLCGACCNDPVLSLSMAHICRARAIGKPLLLRISPSGPLLLQVQHTCLRAVVQLPRVTPEPHPPCTDPPVDLVRQVWGFSHGASQIGEGGCLTILLPRGVEDYLRCRCTRNGHAHGLSLAL